MKKHSQPIIQQFIDHQMEYPYAIVATEVGGFFEIWQVDDVGYAIKASQILDTILTRRSKKDPNSPLMTGFPSHSAEGYFKRLVDAGETVVVVEQTIRGRKADGNKNVTRSVAKILSPGTTLDQLQDSKNNYFASIYSEDGQSLGITLIDVSTGEVKITEMLKSDAQDYLDKIKPREILISGTEGILNFKEKQLVHKNSNKHCLTKLSSCGKLLADMYGINNPTSNPNYSVTSLGLERWRLATLSFGNLLNYLAVTEYNTLLLKKIGNPEIFEPKKHLYMPLGGYLSLEVFDSPHTKDIKHTLVGVLDRCQTAMGKRLLRQYLMSPLTDYQEIIKRHEKVEKFIDKKQFYPEMKDVYDISRLARRMIFGRLMPHEVAQFYQSLQIIYSVFQSEQHPLVKIVKQICELIHSNIDVPLANVSVTDTDYSFFKGDLKEVVKSLYVKWKSSEEKMHDCKKEIEKLLDNDKLRIEEKVENIYLIGPKSLANSDHKKLGLTIKEKANSSEVTSSQWETTSSTYFADKHKYILNASKAWEKFQLDLMDLYGNVLVEISNEISKIDVLTNFAKISMERGYHRPEIYDQDQALINLINLRHPVVEQSSNLTESFVANTLALGADHHTLVIYGANSAGKSTILKSLALNVMMAQIGCFIAADKDSKLSVMDNILTRMSSFDNLSEGLSTFTMEMTELQLALKYSKNRSIFLFDEIGRGTSVEDGEAIAYATLAYLDKPENNGITLFATHYHGLYQHIQSLKSLVVKNLHCYTTEAGELIFSRKLADGPGEGSYGIEVAKSCGLPEELIRIAQRYNQQLAPLKSSRYNVKVEGTICPICNENPVQQTHHIVEQKQGKVKEIRVDGAVREINQSSNLILLCASCHEKITRGEIVVERKTSTRSKDGYLEVTRKKHE